jgi:hypothetical protein
MPNEAPELRLLSTIDAAEIERLGVALERTLYEQALASRARRINLSLAKIAHLSRRLKLCRWVSVGGLLATAGIYALGGVRLGAYALEEIFGLCFVSTLAISIVLPAYFSWVAKPWTSFWMRFARKHAIFLLRAARASVPFEAQYELRGDTAAYSRIVDGRPQAAWRRRLAGLRCSGPGFTLLYKNDKSIAPCALFLHQSSGSFEALLDRQGVKARSPSE